MIRERLSSDLKQALKAQDGQRVSTLRLILAAIKDREIATRVGESGEEISDAEILGILAKMIKQRQESAKAYDEGGRLDLAAQERAEIRIIEGYLPRQMSACEVERAIASAIQTTGASSIRDMGKVMAHLKEQHTGRMDFTRACQTVKQSFRQA